jgi:hypothetical protein
MQRVRISLTAGERRALDAEAARTGRSISSLIRSAVKIVYRSEQSSDDDLAMVRHAFGSWKNRRHRRPDVGRRAAIRLSSHPHRSVIVVVDVQPSLRRRR